MTLEPTPFDPPIVCIFHHYDIGDQSVYVSPRDASAPPTLRAALYCQIMCEEWFGEDRTLSNRALAALLVQLYGHRHCPPMPTAAVIDMHSDREALICGNEAYLELLTDPSLVRDGLREVMTPYVQLPEDDPRAVRILHHFDIGDQTVFVSPRDDSALPAVRAALYCQFKCEEWFGDEATLSNLGVASLLVQFYGYQQCARSCTAATVDMHLEREALTLVCAGDPSSRELKADPSLFREGLRDAMKPFVEFDA